MTSSQKLWLSLAIVSLFATLLFAAGFGYAIRAVVFPASVGAEVETPMQSDNTAGNDGDGVTIVTLGDSLTRGLGDDNGKGYAGYVKEQLEQSNEAPVYLIPFAVNGYRSDELLSDLTEEEGIIAALERADYIFMSIGANDFIQLGEEISPEMVLEQLPETLQRIERIFARLTELNEAAGIVYVGLYHPFAELDPSGEAALLIQQFNQDVFKLTIEYPQITVVPTFDLFYRTSDQFLAPDLFHPNETGYVRIGERVLQVIDANGGDES